ncbi:MaoC/PaaZ C-terminal domain-containing protein [Streptomyces sp. NPDC054796]
MITTQTRTQRLSTAPRLGPLLARGAVVSVGKRGPYDGARLPATRLVLREAPVDADALRAYAHVCRFEAGGTLPPTYPHILGFPLAMRLMADRDFPFPLLGLVHMDIELTQYKALPATARPEISVQAEGLEPHRKGSRFGMVTEARLDGETVWHSRSTYLCRHRTGARPPETSSRDGAARTADEPLPVRDTWELPGDLGRRYAAASGDRNPIHLHPLTAKLFGFPRHIAHGMWTFARCLAEAFPEHDGGDGRLGARAEFKAPVHLPTAVAYGERDGAFELRGTGERARLHLTGRVGRESSGTPSSGSPDRPSRSS